MWGVSWSPPSAGPRLGWDGGVSAPHGWERVGSCPSTLPPVLPPVRTYLAGSRARRGHRLRSSFPGSGRGPRRSTTGMLEPGPPLLLDRPIARGRSRLHPIRAGVAGGRLRVPPLGLQHPSDHGPGRGGAAKRWLGSRGGKTRAAWGGE